MKQERYQLIIKNSKYLKVFVNVCVLLILSLMLNACKDIKSVEGSNESWMKDISDDTYLSEIMMPGLHNAGASKLPLSAFAKCQKYSIPELLDMGYRYLDIRAGVDGKSGERRLILYHNFIPCYNKERIIPQKLTFDDVVKSCCDFLEENPTETIVFMLKYEHGDISVSEFEGLVADATDKYQDKWLLTDETPNLGEARGKIVLYRRYEDEALLGKKSGIECIWENQRSSEIPDLDNLFETLSDEKVLVQDMFKLKTDDKWKVFSYLLDNNSCENGAKKEHPVINFLSTAGNKSVGVPFIYAKDLNQRLLKYDFDETVCPQWIIVDFADESIAAKIIENNNYE